MILSEKKAEVSYNAICISCLSCLTNTLDCSCLQHSLENHSVHYFIGTSDPTTNPCVEVSAALGVSVALNLVTALALVFMYQRFIRGKQEHHQAPVQDDAEYEETDHVGARNIGPASETNTSQAHLDYEEPDTIDQLQRWEMHLTNVALNAPVYQNTLSPRPDRFL